jgi:hypothetical protein
VNLPTDVVAALKDRLNLTLPTNPMDPNQPWEG